MKSASFLGHLFTFSGRMARKDYFIFCVSIFIAQVVAIAMFQPLATWRSPIFNFPLYGTLLASVAVLISATTRRAKDAGCNGFLTFILSTLAPWSSFIIPVLLMFFKSSEKQIDDGIDAAGRDRGNSKNTTLDLSDVIEVLKHVATADGSLDYETQLEFEALCEHPIGLSQSDKSRALQEFKAESTRDSDIVACLKRMKNDGYPEGAYAEILKMALVLTSARVTDARLEKIDDIIEVFDLQPILPPGVEEFICLIAKLAKADGRIDKAEIEVVNEFFSVGMRLSRKTRERAIGAFRDAKDDSKSYQYYADLCAKELPDQALKEAGFSLLLELSVADGDVDEREVEILEYVAEKFGIGSEFDSAAFKDEFQDQQAGAGAYSDRTHSASQRKDEDYFARILGVTPHADKAAIKKAYREQMNKNHPDKVQHLSEAIQNFANEETKKVQEAYDYFKKTGKA